jgi:hypothetical protein
MGVSERTVFRLRAMAPDPVWLQAIGLQVAWRSRSPQWQQAWEQLAAMPSRLGLSR